MLQPLLIKLLPVTAVIRRTIGAKEYRKIRNMKINRKSLKALPLLLIVLFVVVRNQIKPGFTISNIILGGLFVFSLSVLIYYWKDKNTEKKSISFWLLITGLFLSAIILIWNMLRV